MGRDLDRKIRQKRLGRGFKKKVEVEIEKISTRSGKEGKRREERGTYLEKSNLIRIKYIFLIQHNK